MPLPTPSKDESESAFVSHCITDSIVQSDFKTQDQRLAVCYAQWDKAHVSAMLEPIRYCVSAQASEQDGKKYALIEIIDEETSGPCQEPPDTRVRINPEGKTKALADLLEKPLLGPPELGHDATEVVGRAVSYISNHATRVVYEVPDSVYEHLQKREWGPVSSKMTPTTAHFEPDGTYMLDEWSWDNIAFVPKGAWPRAGAKATCIGDPHLCGFPAEKPCGFHHAVAAALSKSWLKAQRPRTTTDVGAYSPEKGKQGSRDKTVGPPGGVTMEKCEHEKVIAELTDKNTTSETEAKDAKAKLTEATENNKKIEAELKELKAKPPAAPPAAAAPVTASDAMVAVQAELKSIKAEYEALKAWKVAAEDADHMRRVQEVIDLQVSTGSVEAAKVPVAVEALKKLPNDALDMMKVTLSAVKGKFDSLPSGPKARLIPSASAAGHFDPMQATVGSLLGKKLGEM